MKVSGKAIVVGRVGFLTCVIGLSCCNSASAVISIDNSATTATDPATNYDATFLNWNNVGAVQPASGTGTSGGGIYLRNGWVLAPQHIGVPVDFYFNSVPYPVDPSTPAVTVYNNPGPGQSNADLVLYKVDTAGLPTLPNVVLTSSTPAVGTSVLMMGFGYERQSSLSYFDTSGNASSSPPAGPYREGYQWGANSNSKRWGTNIISSNNTSANDGSGIFPALVTTFTDPDTGVSSNANDDNGGNSVPYGATQYEASGSPGDSGGGVFVKSGSTWYLAGLIHAIDTYPSNASAFYNANGPFDDSVSGDGYSARTYISDLSQYADQINAVTAPEPASALLFIAPAMLGLLSRRGRRSLH